MKFTYITLILIFLMGSIAKISAQAPTEKADLVQFSGVVVGLDKGDTIVPIPFAHIIIPEENRATYSNLDGFFSIVARKGQLIKFTAVGFQTFEYQIPDTLSTDRYSIVQMLSKDSILLPQATIYPWPSKEHFKEEFLALEVPNQELESIASENLAEERLLALRKSLPRTGAETSAFYLQQQAKSYYYIGQTPPQNIFSPLAWAKFIKALKDGDFKKKTE